MARTLAWAVAAVVAQTSIATNATNASETCDIIVRIGYPEGLAPSPPGSRTNASTPREVSWTDPEAVERRHITLQPSLPKEPSPDRDVRV